MPRRCTTTPGLGTCCLAAQQNMLNRPMKITMANGKVRCAECTVIQRSKGRGPGFQFRFHKNNLCGIGPGGCPALAQPGGLGGQTTLSLPGTF